MVGRRAGLHGVAPSVTRRGEGRRDGDQHRGGPVRDLGLGAGPASPPLVRRRAGDGLRRTDLVARRRAPCLHVQRFRARCGLRAAPRRNRGAGGADGTARTGHVRVSERFLTGRGLVTPVAADRSPRGPSAAADGG